MDLSIQFPILTALGSFVLGLVALRLFIQSYSGSLGRLTTFLVNQLSPSTFKTWLLSLVINSTLLSPQVSQVFSLSLTSTGLLSLRQGLLLVATSTLPILFLLLALLICFPISPWLFIALGGAFFFVLPKNRFRIVAVALLSFGLLQVAFQTLVRVFSVFTVQEEYFNFVYLVTDDRLITLISFYLLSLGLSLIARSTLFSVFVVSAAMIAGVMSLMGAMVIVLGEITGFGVVVWLNSRWSSRKDSRHLGTFALVYPLLASVLAIILMPGLNPWLKLWAKPLEELLPVSPISHLSAYVLWLVMLVLTLAVVGLIVAPIYGKWAEKRNRTYKGKGPQSLRFISPEMGLSPALAIELLREEVLKLSTLVYSMLDLCSDSLFARSEKKLEKYEGITDRVQDEVQDFLISLTEHPLVWRESLMARGLMKVTSSLESIADECRAIATEAHISKDGVPEGFREAYLLCLEEVKAFYEELFEHLETNDATGTSSAKEEHAVQIFEKLKALEDGLLPLKLQDSLSMVQLIQRLRLVVEKLKNIKEAQALMKR